MGKLKNKSALLSVLSTVVLSLGLILSNAGIVLEPMITEAVVAGCAMLTAAGIITAPKNEEKSGGDERGQYDSDEK